MPQLSVLILIDSLCVMIFPLIQLLYSGAVAQKADLNLAMQTWHDRDDDQEWSTWTQMSSFYE